MSKESEEVGYKTCPPTIVVQKVEYFQVRPIGQFNHDAARNFYNLLNCYSARSVTFHQTTIDQGIFYFETWLVNLWDGFRAEYSRIWNAMKFQTLPEEQKRYLKYSLSSKWFLLHKIK